MRVRTRGEGLISETFKVANAKSMNIDSSALGPGVFSSPSAYAARPKSYSWLGGTIRDGVDYAFTSSVGVYTGYMILTDNVRRLVIADAFQRLSPNLTYSDVVTPTSNEAEVMTDTVTPNFRKRVNAGEIIINPMEKVYDFFTVMPKAFQRNSYTVSYRGGSASGSDPKLRLHTFRTVVSVAGALATLDQTAIPVPKSRDHTVELDAIANVYSKIQSAELDVALMAAEGKETLEFITKYIKKALKIIRLATNRKTLAQVAKRTWRRLRSRKRDYEWEADGIAEAWLEVRYALRPLLYDIADAVEYFKEGSKRTGKRTTFRSNVVSEYSNTDTKVASSVTSVYNYTVQTVARAGCIAERRLTSKFADLGFLNLAGVVWEKVKFSFLLDWIINISGLLYTLNPSGTWSPLGAWVKVTQTVTFNGTVTYDSLDGTSISVPFVGRRQSTHRSAVSGPPLTFISVNLDTFKLLDLIALARGMRGDLATLRL